MENSPRSWSPITKAAAIGSFVFGLLSVADRGCEAITRVERPVPLNQIYGTISGIRDCVMQFSESGREFTVGIEFTRDGAVKLVEHPDIPTATQQCVARSYYNVCQDQ